jgi:predicted DCC family thiol-disulfide oxidoreductase YuxK
MHFRYLPMQSLEGRRIAASLGIDPDQPNTFAYIANGVASQKSDAAIRILHELPGWRWTSSLRLIPRTIRDAVYDLIARNRYRWFGRYDRCVLPNADWTWPKS